MKRTTETMLKHLPIVIQTLLFIAALFTTYNGITNRLTRLEANVETLLKAHTYVGAEIRVSHTKEQRQ